MPLYDYACDHCSYSFSKRLKIADRNQPLGQCPECDSGTIQSVLGAPTLGWGGLGEGSLKISDNFNEKLKQIRDCTPSHMHNLDNVIK